MLIEKFNIQVNENTVTQSALLHSDIPGYDLPAIDFVSPQEEAQENHILKEEDSMIYMSCTKCGIHAVVATCSTSVSLLPQCTRAPTKRHSSPVEAVLTGSGAALLGLVEIPKSPVGHSTID